MEFEVRLEPNRPPRKVGRERALPVPDVPVQGSGRFVLGTDPVRNIWRDETQWPFVPAGFLYVPDVFEQIGQALHGDEWTGEEGEFRQNVAMFPRPSEVFQGDTDIVANAEKYREGRLAVGALLHIDMSRHTSTFSNQEWCKATDIWQHFDASGPLLLRRRAEVIGYIHRQAESGKLPLYFRHEGEMLPIRRAIWNCEPALVERRIETGLMNRAPLEYLKLLYGGKTIPFFARESELAGLLSAGKANVAAIVSHSELSPPFRAVMDPRATASERLHEEAAHNVAAIVRETGCKVSAAIRQVRDQVERNNRTEESIDRAIRNAFDRMYDNHGKPKP